MIKEGTIIEGPFCNEPIKVKKCVEIGDRINIVGATVYSKTHIDRLLNKDEIAKVKIKETSLDFSAKGSEVFLAIEATRFKYASVFDPLLAMNTCKIDPLPFQIDAVYGYVLKLPIIRFLIADDPGAGKTIMAGLIIKELKLRGLVNRILIVVPGHLKDQWQRELKEKFQEHFSLIDRNTFDTLYGVNPWQKENQIITSIDFAKKEDILPSLSSVTWDLVIVDEAHKLSAYKYGDKLSKTERYKLGEAISKNSNHLLFLTATPHKGDPENFRLFIDLLKRGFFATQELINDSLINKDNPLFIRRLKEDLRDFEGKPIFTNRFPITIKFRLSTDEKRLYNDLSKYVISQFDKALKIDKRRNIAFALVILQRRMASSVYALFKSLQRRKKKLEDLLFQKQELSKEFTLQIDIDIEEVEDYNEEERWKEEEKWESLSLAKNRDELKKEIQTLNDLILNAEEILEKGTEVKLNELKKAIDEGFKKIEEMNGNKKILIFTESRDTMEYLVNKISSWGYSINYIHGGMKLEERIEAEKIFKNETQIMVATEAAGEGINLQFCHLMINYDIPWNPNKLEQRLGRIHRYGQQKDVYVFNLVAADTREGKILSKLLDKLDQIKNALGSDKVFDIIGDIFHGKNLYQLIIEAIANARSIDDIIKEIDFPINKDYLEQIKTTLLGESLATKFIDYSRIKEMAEKAKEFRLIPEYVEEFFKKAFEKAGGSFKVRKDRLINIVSIPYEIRKIAEDTNFKNKFGPLLKSYSKVTFDKDTAFKNPDVEFISFGHPLFEALIEWVQKNFSLKLQNGAVFEDPDCKYNGVIFFFEGEVIDGRGVVAGKTLLAIYDNGEELRELNPAIVWDLVPIDNNQPITLNIHKENVQEYAINSTEDYRKKILEERNRQAEIKRKYGVKSLEFLIGKLDEEIVEYYEKGKEDISIRNKEERKKEYEYALEELKKEIEYEKTLTISMPTFIGAIVVKPKSEISDDYAMVSDEEIEKIGMHIAMEYEKSQGRIPEDVSKENLGFDIRSKGENEIRYIEVKARKDEGNVVLTQNEWFKAKRFKEQYWLYVVSNAATNPTLFIINNPTENLNAEQKVEKVRFLLSIDEIEKKGIRA